MFGIAAPCHFDKGARLAGLCFRTVGFNDDIQLVRVAVDIRPADLGLMIARGPRVLVVQIHPIFRRNGRTIPDERMLEQIANDLPKAVCR